MPKVYKGEEFRRRQKGETIDMRLGKRETVFKITNFEEALVANFCHFISFPLTPIRITSLCYLDFGLRRHLFLMILKHILIDKINVQKLIGICPFSVVYTSYLVLKMDIFRKAFALCFYQ